jgi:poly(3-hydroxybutyrate) depolymerase
MASLTWMTRRTAMQLIGGGTRGVASNVKHSAAAVGQSWIWPTRGSCSSFFGARTNKQECSGSVASRAYCRNHSSNAVYPSLAPLQSSVKATLLPVHNNLHGSSGGGASLRLLSTFNFCHQHPLRTVVPQSHHRHYHQQQQQRWYTPMTTDEEEQEKVRVA